ncbi:DNA polymerase III subunit delta' [Sedimentibacter sp. zth1]|uniref:DNA polymerase III subunit delta' n=1 Tax=Sedimentibacter sp. zth1 TaxID=2816908 RepID=UPI001A927118|nr:DNA polymerase III subunit delta' [Sedimentibacter sp. zth1]QSX04928.1 DNA polymerase III subunit delta' [Sedimentibacter sp. zth1]
MLFSEFIGQEEIKKYLIKSIQHNNVSHGYIFEGKDGIGKFDMATLFAKSLLCKNFNGEPCDKCSSCIKVNTSNHPDIHVFTPLEKNIKREDVDEIIESINIKPYESDKKIYIIKNSDRMTLQAANTFLKTLEEPVGNRVIILLTENSNLLLPTIYSRCQIITFKYIEKEKLSRYIREKYNLDKNKANLIAYYSKGVLKKAENIASGTDDILQKRLEVFNIFDKTVTLDKNVLFNYEDYFEQNKDNIDEIVDILIILLRDIYFKKYQLDELIINSDCMELLNLYTTKLNTCEIEKIVLYLQSTRVDVNNNINYKLIIDNMLLKLQKGVNL